MKVLITGAAGFLGKHLIHRLSKEDFNLVGMVRENTDTRALEKIGVDIVRADLRKDGDLDQMLEGVDAVVHLATTVKGPWQEYEESTVKGTKRLLTASQKAGVKRFIFISSIGIYDLSKSGANALDEGSPIITGKASFYNQSKILAEEEVVKAVKEGLHCVTLRSAVIYGPNGPKFPPRLGYALGANRALIIGDGSNTIPLVYVENLAEAILMALVKDCNSGEVFNVVDDQTVTQKNFLGSGYKICYLPLSVANILSNVIGFLLNLVKRANPFSKDYLKICTYPYKYSNKKLKNVLGWKPVVASEDAVVKTRDSFDLKLQNHRIVDWKKIQRTWVVNKPMNVGIVGCGVIAKTHLDILTKIKNLHVVGLCDPNLELAESLSKEYGGINFYTSIDDMLAKENIQVVHILTPPQTRKELALKASEKGCHILLEKPMALNAQDAKAIVESAKKNKVKVCVGHNHVYDPYMIEARKLIQSGAVGEIVSVESWYGFNLGANLASRYMTPEAAKHWTMQLPGKLYQNFISHPISVMSDVMGYPENVHAMTVSGHVVKSMKNDELKVMVKGNNKVGFLTVSLAINPRYQFLNIYGTNMCIFVDFLNKTLIKHATPKGIPKAISRALAMINMGWVHIVATIRNIFKVLTKSFTYYDGTEILFKEFYRCLVDEEEMPVSGEDGLKSMELMDEIWRQVEL